MIVVQVIVPFSTCRKAYARSLAETYQFAPPSTVYGMMLSLVGEFHRAAHADVNLAFAYASVPEISVNLRQLSSLKFDKLEQRVFMDKVEVLCDVRFYCWIDSTNEADQNHTLEQLVTTALTEPEKIKRSGPLYLGLSDDCVDMVKLVEASSIGPLLRLKRTKFGKYELPVWADHVKSRTTVFARYDIDDAACDVTAGPSVEWPYTCVSRTGVENSASEQDQIKI